MTNQANRWDDQTAGQGFITLSSKLRPLKRPHPARQTWVRWKWSVTLHLHLIVVIFLWDIKHLCLYYILLQAMVFHAEKLILMLHMIWHTQMIQYLLDNIPIGIVYIANTSAVKGCISTPEWVFFFLKMSKRSLTSIILIAIWSS